VQVQRALGQRGDVTVLAITPGTPEALRRLRADRGLKVRLIADPSWSLHQALGFARGQWRTIWLSPRTIVAYLRLLGRGRRPHRPAQDVFQLGGDVVLDARGVVTWIYRSRHPADRPAIAEIVRHLDAAAARHAAP
jgi:hypothetical protein